MRSSLSENKGEQLKQHPLKFIHCVLSHIFRVCVCFPRGFFGSMYMILCFYLVNVSILISESLAFIILSDFCLGWQV